MTGVNNFREELRAGSYSLKHLQIYTEDVKTLDKICFLLICIAIGFLKFLYG